MLEDTGERIIPPKEGEVSFLFNRHRMAYLFASRFSQKKIVLDAGCGTGYGSHILANTEARVYGIDYSFQAIKYSTANYSHENSNFIVMDVNYLGFRDCTFDLIVSFQVIEHMRHLDLYLNELIRVLKDEGTILISTPNVQEKQKRKGTENKFHFNELTYEEAKGLMQTYFEQVEFYGTHYRQRNILRTFVQNLFFYRQVGRMIPRRNVIKKIAKSALKLDDFIVTESNIKKAMDLIIVARHPKKSTKFYVHRR